MPYLRDDKKDKLDEQAQSPGLLSGYVAPSSIVPMAQNAAPQQSSLYGTGGSGPTATGHINFDSIYAANEGTAQREAGKLAGNAAGLAHTAQQGLSNLKSQFSSQSKAAEGVGPSEQQRQWATNASTGVMPGKVVRGAYYTQGQSHVLDPNSKHMGKAGENYDVNADADTQSYVTENQEGLQSQVRQKPGADGTTPAEYNQDNAAADEAAVRAGAAGKYTGPGSLGDMAGYKGLLQDYGKAQHSLAGLQDNAHLQAAYDEQNQGPAVEGGSRLDAALAGQAGRERFANLRNTYRNLGREPGAANLASIAQGNASRAAAEQNAKSYQGLLDQYTGRQSADQQAEADSQARSDKAVADAQQHAKNIGDFNYDMQAGTIFDKGRNALHKLAFFTNPVDWALKGSGNKTLTEASTDQLGQKLGLDSPDKFNYGNKSDAWQTGDEDVYASMSPADWTEFNSMGEAEQRAWIEARKKKLSGGG